MSPQGSYFIVQRDHNSRMETKTSATSYERHINRNILPCIRVLLVADEYVCFVLGPVGIPKLLLPFRNGPKQFSKMET